MEMNELIIGGVGLVTTIMSGWVSWLFTKKKYNSEVDHNLIENMETSLEFYRKLSDNNKEKLDELLEENKALRREIDELRKQLQEITTNLYLDESFKNRVKIRELQLKNQRENAKKSSRVDITEKADRRRRKPSDPAGDSYTEEC